LDKIIHLHDDILKYLVNRQIISILAGKLPLENEEIKKIIYKDLNYIIKSSSEYTKELFDLAENEKEGRNIICSQEEIIVVLNEGNILKCLIYEDIELFIPPREYLGSLTKYADREAIFNVYNTVRRNVCTLFNLECKDVVVLYGSKLQAYRDSYVQARKVIMKCMQKIATKTPSNIIGGAW
jgi:hypothetical protein